MTVTFSDQDRTTVRIAAYGAVSLLSGAGAAITNAIDAA